MRDYKEIAKTNRFVAAVNDIHDISMNKSPINYTGDVVDAGIALDMFVDAHNIDLGECSSEYREFKRIIREVNWNLDVIINALK